MLRFAAIALMLSPGIAQAQKFVTVGDDPTTAPTSAEAAPTEENTVATIDPSTLDPDTVFDGATVEEIEALLANAETNALEADERNAIVVRVATDDEGQSVLTLDVADTDGSAAPAGEDPSVASLELGECNEGTNWVSDEVNCYNAYPAAAD